jgi:hypothetical protein
MRKGASATVKDYDISKYIRALGSLSKTLSGKDAFSADTLCAVMLLGIYEVRILVYLIGSH